MDSMPIGYQSTYRNESYLKDRRNPTCGDRRPTLDLQGNPLRGNTQDFRNA